MFSILTSFLMLFNKVLMEEPFKILLILMEIFNAFLNNL